MGLLMKENSVSTIPDQSYLKADFIYFAEVSYDGTEYLGWQTQPHGKTIQSVIEKKLCYLYNAKIPVTSSGRTDAGVHALGMGISFVPPKTPPIAIDTLFKALNSILPYSIRINRIEKKSLNFNARFDAKGKAYTYVMHNSPDRRPFSSRYSMEVKGNLDINAMAEASKYLIGIHDFSSFAVEINKSGKEPVRNIFDIKIQQFGNYICITIIGESFLYKMVRSIVGTLYRIGLGKLSPKCLQEILDSKNRLNAYDTAQPHGLFLMKVFYKENEWKEFSISGVPFHI